MSKTIIFIHGAWVTPACWDSFRKPFENAAYTGSEKDLLVSPYVTRSAFRIQRRSAARTDYAFFPGLSHLLIGEPGWEDVAAVVQEWLAQLDLPAAAPARPPLPSLRAAA
ncbi:hypothetical protein CLG96_16410 [Sphingomonas oleivorans]|uniref:Alpha/beta hydrolase n=1 Tax=Sphingomonas oleivorans TaxID=1735121 RepID=A0A2T5FTY9_9SPHN|nr:hypothetical protein [Sphingomonas oleivorans]PTQ07741.1 hypothetical protein CLG96_16410 [Sphingomonas oleivorans]